ncbi:unnamed protein product, partial [Symbiodinium pilosum]
ASQPRPSGEHPSPRARALAALAHLGLDGDAGDAAAGQSDAETVSDTLSAHTAIASPPHTPRSYLSLAHNRARTTAPTPGEPEDLVHGEVAPTQADEATPGYSPVDALAPCDAHAPALCDARPPRSSPPERLSWLYVPLLHAAAGSLSEEAVRAWSSHPSLGDRWAALVSAMPMKVRPVAAADIDLVNVLTAFPDSVLPLPAAVALSASPDGYLTAAAQSALLETFGGGTVAAAAQALAEDMRHALDYAVPECPQEAPERPSPAPSRRRRGCRGRGRGRGRQAAAQLPAPAGTVDADEGSTQARPAGISEAARDAFDAIDLKEELRHPVPTLQDAYAVLEPRAAELPASRAWKLFFLAPRMLLARPDTKGARGRDELLARARAFERGEWVHLLRAARRQCTPARGATLQDAEALAERKRAQSCAKVRLGELSRARHILTAAELAPGDETT